MYGQNHQLTNALMQQGPGAGRRGMMMQPSPNMQGTGPEPDAGMPAPPMEMLQQGAQSQPSAMGGIQATSGAFGGMANNPQYAALIQALMSRSGGGQ